MKNLSLALNKVLKTLLGFVRSDTPYSGMRLAVVLMVITPCIIVFCTFCMNAFLIYQGKKDLLEYNWLEAAAFAGTGLGGKYLQKKEEVKHALGKAEAENKTTEDLG